MVTKMDSDMPIHQYSQSVLDMIVYLVQLF